MKRSFGRIICLVSLAAISAGLPAASDEVGSELAQQKAAVGQAIDEATELMFKPGELDPNWNKGGVDLEKAVKAKPNQALLEVDNDGERSILLYSEKPMVDFVPPEWELIAEIGNDTAQTDDTRPIEISELEGGYYVASRSTYERVGDAFCSPVPATAQLYKVKGASKPEMSPEIAKFIFHKLLDRAKPYTVCTRHDVVGIGYRARFFFKDGRSLPVFDDMTGIATIVPLRPTAELFKRE